MPGHPAAFRNRRRTGRPASPAGVRLVTTGRGRNPVLRSWHLPFLDLLPRRFQLFPAQFLEWPGCLLLHALEAIDEAPGADAQAVLGTQAEPAGELTQA